MVHSEDRDEGTLDLDEALSATGRKVGDVLRKALVTGVGGLLTTEEGLRSVVADLKLSKESLGVLLSQAERTKSDMSRALEREIHSVLETVDLKRLLQRALTGMVVEITAEVRFRNDDAGKPVPDVRVSTRSTRKAAARPAKKRRAAK